MRIREIDVDRAAERLAAGDALFLDVRDPGSYEAGHVAGARRIDDQTVEAFLRDTDKTGTVIVYCYHGHMSQGGAAYLMEHGFEDVYSMAGGYEAWSRAHPDADPG